VNQSGRGYEPTMVVGRIVSTILRIFAPRCLAFVASTASRRPGVLAVS